MKKNVYNRIWINEVIVRMRLLDRLVDIIRAGYFKYLFGLFI